MRFFLKLFLSFLLTVLIAGVLLFWSGHHLRAEMDVRLRQQMQQLLQERQGLAALIAAQGEEGARQRLLASPHLARLRILDADHREILGRPLPELLQRRLAEGEEGGGPPSSSPLLCGQGAGRGELLGGGGAAGGGGGLPPPSPAGA
ncbi:MAG: hypothetical protein H7835_00265 [Magnetococcus sp. XQGC-1]